jgi:hypothetical protein
MTQVVDTTELSASAASDHGSVATGASASASTAARGATPPPLATPPAPPPAPTHASTAPASELGRSSESSVEARELSPAMRGAGDGRPATWPEVPCEACGKLFFGADLYTFCFSCSLTAPVRERLRLLAQRPAARP